jgi:dimethylglycine dehydrogenase
MQSHARVVVVGGGAVGANILYSLTRRGWNDVVLLERNELTSGSTWHAAGLIPLYTHRFTLGRMVLKSIEIYEGLEADTGQAVGWHNCGSLRLASDAERFDEYRWHAGSARTQGVEAHILTPQEVRRLWPLIENGERVLGGLYHPQDGHIAPADVTQALAKGARDRGAKIHRNTEALAFEQTPGHEWKVKTIAGDITAEHLVVATGSYAQRTARRLSLFYPAIPVVHQYYITEEVPEIVARKKAGLPEMPILKDDRYIGYLREERQGLMFGPYEAPDDLELFALDDVPDGFGAMSLLPENLDPVAAHIEAAMQLVPAFARAGVKAHVRGPICTTPDNQPLAGPVAGKRNLWLAEGVAGGIVMGGGLGHYLSEMIVEGDCSIDFTEFDPRRFGSHVNKPYASIKAREAFGNNFGIYYPDYEWPAARPLKTSPCHDRLKAAGAVFGSVNGWEVPVWFAPPGVEPRDVYSYRRSNYSAHVADEARSMRQAAGLIDMTPMAKFEVGGPGAAAWLDRILANHLPQQPGGIRLAHLLSERGGVKAEFTVVRLNPEAFYLISSPKAEALSFDQLARLLPEEGTVHLRNVTMERGCLTIVGPKARAVLGPITTADLSNERFPWLTAQTAVVGLASDVRMLRIDFEGELGWQLHHALPYQQHLLDSIMTAGKEHGLRLVGYRAMDGLRLEKSYANLWRELNGEYTAWESNLDRYIALDKGDFMGRDALIRQKANGVARRLVTLRIAASEGAEALGNEEVYSGGTLVGRVTSAGHAYHLGFNIALAHVAAAQATSGTSLEVMVFNEKVPAVVIPSSPYDPKGERSRM